MDILKFSTRHVIDFVTIDEIICHILPHQWSKELKA